MQEFQNALDKRYDNAIANPAADPEFNFPIEYEKYYQTLSNKFIKLDKILNSEDLKYLRIEPQPLTTEEVSKSYFMKNHFIFLKHEYLECSGSRYEMENDKMQFYIVYNYGSNGSYECCASIILRYKINNL